MLLKIKFESILKIVFFSFNKILGNESRNCINSTTNKINSFDFVLSNVIELLMLVQKEQISIILRFRKPTSREPVCLKCSQVDKSTNIQAKCSVSYASEVNSLGFLN